jgi:cytochrome b
MFDSDQLKQLHTVYAVPVSHNFMNSAALKVSMFTVRVWDLPTRLFHGALAICVLGLFITAELGGEAMVWHFRLGFAVLTLLLFRLMWGLLGGHWSRWLQLSLRPSLVRAYLQGRHPSQHWVGHNPLGSWSVLAFLFFLGLQVGTGLISDDEISNVGPLSFLVPGRWVSWATTWHKDWGQVIVVVLIALHLSALAWYHFKKKLSLVPAMVHGDKTLTQAVTPSRDDALARCLALGLFLLSALGVYLLVSIRP